MDMVMNVDDTIRAALAHVPANDRDIWLRMGMAVKSEMGDAGYPIWDEWSQHDDSYSEPDSRAVWRSIKSGGKTTIGTLYREAQRHGFKMNGHARPARFVPSPDQVAKVEADAHREAESRTKAADFARKLLAAAVPARADHPYLERKRVPPVVTLRELPATEIARHVGYVVKGSGEPLVGRVLIVPVRIGDRLSTLEFIDENGRKSALKHGAKAGGFWSAQRLPDGDGEGLTLRLAEGAATALTLLVTTEDQCFAALSRGMLVQAATALRQRYPKARIVVCGDLGNGATDAHKAAHAVGGLVAFPDFGDGLPHDGADFNDLGVQAGIEAVKRSMANAREPEVSTHQPAAPNASAGATHDVEVTLIRGDTIKAEAVRWLWREYLAAGKLHVVAGAPGTGKTTLALALAATLTIGGRWPDGSRAPLGDVLIWSGEDAPADTLKPRLLAAGADMSRVHFVGDARQGSEPIPFDPAQHFPALALAASRLPELRMMIVDPIVSAVAGDSHKNAEVRRGLQPLVEFADAAGCVLFGVTHFTKGTQGREPLERVTGSLGFGAVARLVFATAKLPEADGGGRALVRVKNNLGPDGGGFKYEIRQVELTGADAGIVASRVEWCGPIEGSAREILANAEQQPSDGQSEQVEAGNWLRDRLTDAGGEMDRREIMLDAKAAGFSERTVDRAKADAGVRVQQSGFGKEKRSFWRIGENSNPATFPPIPPSTIVGGHSAIGGANGEIDVGEVF